MALLMDQIKRSAVTVAGTDEFSLNLGQDAASVLGYAVLSEVQTDADSGPIARALAELGIEALNAQDVIQYKHERRMELARANFEAWSNDPARLGNERWDRFSCPLWEVTEISKYKERIPEFVLNKAIQIKKAVPDCQIVIEHLTEHPDPFLVVQTNIGDDSWKTPAERFWVEVWDEPKFEGRVR